MVLDQGYNHIDACRSLVVVDSVLPRWVKRLQQERAGVILKSKALPPNSRRSKSWRPGSTGWGGRKRS